MKKESWIGWAWITFGLALGLLMAAVPALGPVAAGAAGLGTLANGSDSTGTHQRLGSQAATPSIWVQLTRQGQSGVPSPRSLHNAVWDTQSGRMLLFAGTDERTSYNDLWEYTGAGRWGPLPAEGDGAPPLRFVHAATWDPQGNRLLVFGGEGNDLWQYTATGSWQQLRRRVEDPSPPPLRTFHAIAWDTQARRLLLFGGDDTFGGRLNDLWQFTNDRGWQQLTAQDAESSPPARSGHSLTWDGQANRLLLFGGSSESATYNDLWQYTTAGGWQQLTAQDAEDSPSNRGSHAAAWDPRANRLLIMGGLSSVEDLVNDVWQYTTAGRWQKLSENGRSDAPAPRSGHSAVWDNQANRLLVFGGEASNGTRFGDLWAFVPGAPLVPTLTPTTDPGTTPTPTPAPGSTPTPAPKVPSTVYVPTVRNASIDPLLGGTWRTGMQVVNLDRSNAAQVRIRYLRPDGSEAAATAPATVAAGKSRTFFGESLGVGEGFAGSAIVSADAAISVIVNQIAEDKGLSASFQGISQTDSEAYVPIALRGAAGSPSTTLYVQNVGTVATTEVNLELFQIGGTELTVFKVLSGTIPPGAALEVPLATLSDIPDGFQGSALVSADQPLAVVAYESNSRYVLGSIGQAHGVSRLHAPLVMNNNGGFSSSVQVQNLTGATTTVTAKLYSSATGALVKQQARVVAPAISTRWTISELLGNDAQFVGSLTVETAVSNGQLVAVVNQINPATNQGSAYNLLGEGTETLVAPLVQTSNSGWNSGFQVQNVGSAPATVTVQVVDSSGRTVGTVSNPTRTIAPGKSETWFPITALGTRVVGSAIATGPAGAKLVGVVNQLKQDAGAVDTFTTYEAINQ